MGGYSDVQADIALVAGDRLMVQGLMLQWGWARSPCCRWTRSVSRCLISPVGLTDYATSVRVHGDQIVPERNPGAALDGRSVDDVLADAEGSAAAQGFTATDRVLSTASWRTADELTDNLLAIFAAGASLVQVANPEPTLLDRRRTTEKTTKG